MRRGDVKDPAGVRIEVGGQSDQPGILHPKRRRRQRHYIQFTIGILAEQTVKDPQATGCIGHCRLRKRQTPGGIISVDLYPVHLLTGRLPAVGYSRKEGAYRPGRNPPRGRAVIIRFPRQSRAARHH